MSLRIATFNVNGVNGRLGNLLAWLRYESPDVACLQELKAVERSFPAATIEAAGYRTIWHGERSWNGVAILSKGAEPVERRRGLPWPRGDAQSRYIEAEVGGIVIASLYLPNGNPQPGPKFDYHGLRHLQSEVLAPRRAAPAGKPRGIRAPAEAGVDRCGTRIVSGRAHLYLLGLFPQSLGPRCGAAHRPPATQPRARATTRGRRGRSLGARRAQAE
jgi:hypothetical protein